MPETFDAYYKWLGIPPKDQPPNHYRLLGIEVFESDPQVIDSAADRQMKHIRTFQSGPHVERSQDLLSEIAAARLCLLRKEKKAVYDAKLQASLDAAAGGPASEFAELPLEDDTRAAQKRQQAAKTKTAAIAGGIALVLAVLLAGWWLTRGTPEEPEVAVVTPSTPATPGTTLPTPVPGPGGTKPVTPSLPVTPPNNGGTPQPAPTPANPKNPANPKPPVPEPEAAPPELFGGIDVVGTLVGKAEPQKLAPLLATPFRAPPGDGRSGANGVLIFAQENWQTQGTRWKFNYEQTGNGWGVQIIHPWKEGQILVSLRDTVQVFAGGSWGKIGWTGQDSLTLSLLDDAEATLPLKQDIAYAIESTLDADGVYRLTIDGLPIAEAMIEQVEPLVLAIPNDVAPPGVPRKEDFQGDGLPGPLHPGGSGLIVGPLDSGRNVITAARLSPLESPPIDLIPLIDLKRDVVAGEWKVEDGTLSLTTRSEGPTNARLRLPVDPPEEYTLIVEAMVKEKGTVAPVAGIMLGLVAARRQFAFVGDIQEMTGLAEVDGDPWNSNETTRKDVHFTAGERATIFCTVRKRSVEVVFQDRTVIRWRGEFNRLRLPTVLDVEDSKKLFVAGHSKLKITKLAIAPPMRAPQATEPAPDPAILAGGRQPVPDAAALEQATTAMMSTLGDEFAAAKSAEAKLQLFDILMKIAEDPLTEDPAQYAALTAARDLATDAGDAGKAFQAIGFLAVRFEVDELALKSAALAKAAKSVKTGEVELQKGIARTAMELVTAASDAERMEVADDAVTIAVSAATKSRDTKLANEARGRRDGFKDFRKQAEAAAQAKQAIASNPEDAAAHLVLGKYLSFTLGNWDEGLTHLAKSSDAGLKAIAELELAAPLDPGPKAAIGDAWFKLAESAPRADRVPYQLRAREWYEEARNSLNGLEKTRVDKQLKELASLTPRKTNQRASGTFPGLAGRIQVNRTDLGLVLLYRPEKFLRRRTLDEVLKKHSLPTRNPTIEFLGFLYLTDSTVVEARQMGGSNAGGVVALSIDGKLLGTVGDNRVKDTIYKVTLEKGLHPVRWVVRGNDIGGGNLIEFRQEGTRTVLPVVCTKELLAQVRTGLVLAEVDVSSD